MHTQQVIVKTKETGIHKNQSDASAKAHKKYTSKKKNTYNITDIHPDAKKYTYMHKTIHTHSLSHTHQIYMQNLKSTKYTQT